jgi:hypothetical protein
VPYVVVTWATQHVMVAWATWGHGGCIRAARCGDMGAACLGDVRPHCGRAPWHSAMTTMGPNSVASVRGRIGVARCGDVGHMGSCATETWATTGPVRHGDVAAAQSRTVEMCTHAKEGTSLPRPRGPNG